MRRFLHQLTVFAICLSACPLFASVRYNQSTHIWSLISGNIEYRIGQRPDDGGAISLLYFGPAGGKTWPDSKHDYTKLVRYEIAGMVDGEEIRPEYLSLERYQILNLAPDRTQLRLYLKHKFSPLEVEAVYTTYGETGVFTKQITFTNTGHRVLEMEAAPSLAWRLPPGEYDLSYLHGGRTRERQLTTVPLEAAEEAFVDKTGRSSNGYSSWFDLRDRNAGIQYAAELAYSGNWQMSFRRTAVPAAPAREDVCVKMGMRFDFGAAAPLRPGASFGLPYVAFTASAGDLNDIVNQLHHYQRAYVFPHSDETALPLVSFSMQEVVQKRAPTAAEVKQYADLVAPLGVEAMIVDAGWFQHPHTQNALSDRENPIYGDWTTDRDEFPNGLRAVSDYVHSKGMKFGVWVELECASTESQVVKEHPDWVLRYNGIPMPGTRNRVYLDFRKPEVRAFARAVIDRLVQKDGVDWLKMDYNVDIGEEFDPASSELRTGTVLHDDLKSYFAMLDQVRRAYPKVIIEDCSSGGARIDLEIMSRMDMAYVSDNLNPKSKAQLEYGCTLEFAPEICSHWVVDNEGAESISPSTSPEWLKTLFRLPMLGELGMSARVAHWTPAQMEIAKESIAEYKGIRSIIASGDVYHLTAPPQAGESPTGWMAIQYVSPDAARSALFVFRLTDSSPARSFQLHGLNDDARYQIEGDGVKGGIFTGAELRSKGVTVTRAAEWDSSLVEINTVK